MRYATKEITSKPLNHEATARQRSNGLLGQSLNYRLVLMEDRDPLGIRNYLSMAPKAHSTSEHQSPLQLAP